MVEPSYGPKDLPELRADLAAAMTGDMALQVKHADLYYVSSPMVDLALAASVTLVGFDVQESDVPSPDGLIYFEKSPFASESDFADVALPVVAALWHVFEGREAMNYWLAPRHEVASSIAAKFPHGQQRLARRPELLGRLPLLNPMYGEDYGFTDGERSRERLFMTSVWLLMQQAVAREETIEYNRADRKRLARKRIEPAAVRVIHLRRSANQSQAGETDHEYHHQWIVRGHWRQQWYPARQVHRPVWIAPHVKGPEGAPLLGGDKVYAWTR